MGHAYSNFQKCIVEEFEKAADLNKSGDSRDYLALDQVLKMSKANWENYHLDFSHLGTLFELDAKKNGKFELRVSTTVRRNR